MYTHRRFTLKQTLSWTRKDIIFFFIVSTYPVCIFEFLGWDWIGIPTLPIALMGTAVAFNIGFKNNNAYDRSWEARKVWGAIVNSSRTWGIMTLDFITNQFVKEGFQPTELELIHKRIIYRHLAWLTALRFQLRQPKEWEHHQHIDLIKYRAKFFEVAEQNDKIDNQIDPYLSKEEKEDALSRANPASYIVRLQSKELKSLREKDLIDDFRHMEMEKMLGDLYTQQGKSERIKNYPFPRQYATMSYMFVMIFIYALPFALLQPFSNIGPHFVWLSIPFSVLVSWIFFTMEKIGDYSENPFEGTGNDVPITALARTIEIDLRDMLNEKDLPEAVKPKNSILT